MEYLKQYVVLYKKARTDLRVSNILFENFENGDEDLDLESIMFHLQQCAEKLFKSLLAYNKLHFTKVHDLFKLYSEIEKSNIKLIDNCEILLSLSEYAVDGRYGMLNDDLENVDKYMDILNKLVEFVQKELGLV